jgi:hypothetical protein
MPIDPYGKLHPWGWGSWESLSIGLGFLSPPWNNGVVNGFSSTAEYPTGNIECPRRLFMMEGSERHEQGPKDLEA